MAYEADAHRAQMTILTELLLVPSASYSNLQKKTKLGSDHFNFHIQKLVKEGYVEKLATGYRLSRKGKEYANRIDTADNAIEKQLKISVALIIENEQGEFLAQQRLKQPYYGYWGRPTGKIKWGETFLQAAERELMEETGLTADLCVAGFYHKMDYEQNSGNILEDKLFVLIYGNNPQNILIETAEGCRNAWMSDEEVMTLPKKFQSIEEITRLAKTASITFLEEKYEYAPEDY